MNQQQLEFAISQYVDGTLPLLERRALEERLERDPAARQLLEEYRSLSAVLEVGMPALPDVDFDALSQRISQKIAEVELPHTHRWRIGGWAVGLGLSMAASVLIAGLAGYLIYAGFFTGGTGRHSGAASVNAQAITEIAVLTTPTPTGPAVQNIVIGPSPAVASIPAAARYGELAISRPGKVIIAAGEAVSRPSGLPY